MVVNNMIMTCPVLGAVAVANRYSETKCFFATRQTIWLSIMQLWYAPKVKVPYERFTAT